MTEESELELNEDIQHEEPVAILVQMVKSGQIDPWNIDIVDVTEKYLSELERRHELDLRVSGRTIFYAAVLLRMKTELLDEPEPDEDESYDDDYFSGSGDPFSADDESVGFALGPIEQLEREIDRRLKRKDARKRKTNLYELIKQLRLAEKIERRRQRRQRLLDPGEDLFDEPDTEEVVGIAHDEDYEERAEQIYDIIASDPEATDTGVSLDELVKKLNWPLYLVYLPCLFLVQSGLVDLEQDEIFGDLWVVMLSADSEKTKQEA
ncbi:MAG: ScpA family protein [Methanocorpusculum sp.]|nr:ScpA family protein [Methanocorpusculum sp.]